MPNKSTKDKITALPETVSRRLFSYRELIKKGREVENYEFCKTLKEMCNEYCEGLRDAGMLSRENAHEIWEYLTI